MIAQGGLCAKSQVYRVAERFITEGLQTADRREDNGERKITPVYERELLSLVEQSPPEFGYRRPTWTQELLDLVLAERVEISTAPSAAGFLLLGRSGIALKRPKPIVNCPWKKAHRTRRLRTIQRLVENLPANEVVLYLDEVDIHLNPKIGPDHQRGRQKKVLTPGCNEKCYLAGAWNPKTRRLIYVEGERKTSLLFLELLYTLVTKAYPNAKRIHIILDNYGIHDSLQVQLALKTAAGSEARTHLLPPYCPDHNRIERIWKDLHDNVTRNHRCATMDELMAEVRSYLAARNRRGHHTYARTGVA